MNSLNSTIKKILSYVAYPVTLFSVTGLQYILFLRGFQAFNAAFLSIGIGMVLLIMYEHIIVYRNSWRETFKEYINDFDYMIYMQVVLPRLVAVMVAIAILSYGDRYQLLFISLLWPHTLPLLVQAVILFVVTDFMVYWLHRWSHRFNFLWRFHKVHHTPKNLYWLNTIRIHFVEKILTVCLDTIPFLVMGVSAEVIALYITWTSVNGFFQHSNADVKFGPLNYLIATAQLHRYHHSIVHSESNTNFGTNLVIWDVVFRTRYLPKHKEVGELGIEDKRYPEDFLHQQMEPIVGKS